MPLRMGTIVCSIDLSDFSETIVRLGARLAKIFTSRLIVFHSVPFRIDTLYGTDRPERSHKCARMTRTARETIDRFMQGVTQPWELVMVDGDPVDALHTVADQQEADLVIAASHGLSGFKRLLLGTVVERMVRHIPRPILVVRPNSRRHPVRSPEAFENILVSCDLKSRADRVADYSARLAERFQAGLHLIHAVESPMNTDVIDPTGGPYGNVQEELRQRLNARLMEIASGTGTRQPVHTAAVPGMPGEVLASKAREIPADLIVVGVRHHGPLMKTLIGSTTESILRCAPCAVLAVPSGDVTGRRRNQEGAA